LASSIKLLGEHNHANVLATLAVLDSFGIDVDVSKRAISQFSGLTHRMQFIREKDGVVWINDSKATNVGATMAAIEGLKGEIVLIAGGQSKGAEFDELLPAIKKYVTHVCLIGEDADKIYASWSGVVKCQKMNSLQEAVKYVDSIAHEGQYALLAPACASFDMFPSFVDRGNQFMKMVNDL
jgi:UDP-N-acetylmuramoylalanine--D-glutamate ligase